MNVFAALIPVFHWIAAASPLIAAVIVLILITRKWFGSRLDPKVFYVVWIILVARLLVPWYPASGLSAWDVIPHTFYEKGMYESVAHAGLNTVEEVTNSRQGTPVVSTEYSWMEWTGMSGSDAVYVIWLVGMIAVLLHHGVTYLKWRRKMMDGSTVVSDARLLSWFAECKVKVGVKKQVPILATALVPTPATFGFWNPKVLIPEHLAGRLDREEWECIFIHELIHIRRRDYMWNGLMMLVSALHWFNPLMWTAFLKMREDQEVSCDAKTMEHVSKVQYGKTLIKMLEMNAGMNKSIALPFISGKNNRMRRRVEMILSKKKTIFTFIAVIFIAFVTVVAITSPGVGAKEKDVRSFNVSIPFTKPAEGEVRLGALGELDILNEEGTPVYAVEEGRIEEAGYAIPDGNHIIIAHGGDYQSTYSHLQQLHVKAGDTVEKGQLIGTIGTTGRSLGPHLAFTLQQNGQSVDLKQLFDITQ